MNIFSYKMDHDYGLAPNPFWGTMTLAVCKGRIRSNKKLKIGDWIVGTGSVKLGYLGKLIFAMKVEEKLTFEEYWNKPEFECKRPIINGSLVQMYGDNFYHQTTDGTFIQEPSAHNNDNGTPNINHKERDLRGKYVLLSKTFYYFGNKAPTIPNNLKMICCKGRDFQSDKIPQSVRSHFISWIRTNYSLGIHGDPINWRAYKLPSLKIYDIE